MRKLALLSVALLPLLGGCVSNVCDYPTATISWRLQDANGVPWNCFDAGVSSIDVYFNGTQVGPHFACNAGGAVIDLGGIAPGTYEAIVEGTDSNGTILDRSNAFTATVSDCGDRRYAPVLGEGLLNLDYHFGPPGTAADLCYGSGTGYIWFDLLDEVTGRPITSIATDTSTAPPSWRDHYACGNKVQFPVPWGTYTLLGIQEVVAPLTATPLSVAESCSPTRATVDSLGTATVTYLTPSYLVPPAIGAAACYPNAAP